MTTPITANVAAASGGIVGNANASGTQANQAGSAAQSAQASQAAAQRVHGTAESNDKRRGVQNPKRTEAAFAAQDNKKVPAEAPDEESKESPKNVYSDTNRLNIKI